MPSSTLSSNRLSSRRSSLSLPKSTPKSAQRVLRDAVHLRSLQSFVSSVRYSRTLVCLLALLVLALLRLASFGFSHTARVVDGATGLVAPGVVDADGGVKAGVSELIRAQFAAEGGVAELRQLLLDMVGPVPVMGTSGVGSSRNGGPNVTVVAVNFAYRELAMNFVCRLGRLGMDRNYVVLAMDRALYNYASKRGVNVFYHSVLTSEEKANAENGPGMDAESDVPAVEPGEDHGRGNEDDVGFKFGSRGFVRTSQRKSMLVAEVLALGYDVFFSDVDVVLYSNPHKVFREYGEDFLIMSDVHMYNRSQELNYNVNSGFYFVRARPRNFVALRAIVKYGKRSKRSEQKAFNHVLCGAFKDDVAGPGWRFASNRCFYRIMGGVSTRVLPAPDFPNGSDAGLFELAPSVFVGIMPGMVAMHVNYVSGRDEKKSRIKAVGQWFFDADGCLPLPAGANPEPAAEDLPHALSDARRARSRRMNPVDLPGLDGAWSARREELAEQGDMQVLLEHQARMEAQKQKQRQAQVREQRELTEDSYDDQRLKRIQGQSSVGKQEQQLEGDGEEPLEDNPERGLDGQEFVGNREQRVEGKQDLQA